MSKILPTAIFQIYLIVLFQSESSVNISNTIGISICYHRNLRACLVDFVFDPTKRTSAAELIRSNSFCFPRFGSVQTCEGRSENGRIRQAVLDHLKEVVTDNRHDAALSALSAYSLSLSLRVCACVRYCRM